jgi:DNA-binding CsgD family transcriptional regulator
MLRWGGRRASVDVQLYARYVRCLATQADGDFEQAFREISVLAVPGTFSANVSLALWASMDFVECAVRTHRNADAAAYIAMVHASETADLSPRLTALTRCAAAMVTTFEPAQFERALSVPGTDQCPFDLARIKLAYAERLRRNRLGPKARSCLTEACATFQELGAQPWLARATQELHAASRRTDNAGCRGQSLTAQEREIAELAAAGFTNKEIARRVYLSHRTVGAHLYRVFPKLGIATRAALRDALEGMAASPARANTSSPARSASVA